MSPGFKPFTVLVKYVKTTVLSYNNQPLSNKSAHIGVVCNLYGAPLRLINSFREAGDQNKTNKYRQIQLRVCFVNSAYCFTRYSVFFTVTFSSQTLQIQIRNLIYFTAETKKKIFKLFMYTAYSIYYLFSYVFILKTVNLSIFLTYIFLLQKDLVQSLKIDKK